MGRYDPRGSYDSFDAVAEQVRKFAEDGGLLNGSFHTGTRPIEVEGEPIGKTEYQEDGTVRFYDFFDKRKLVKEVEPEDSDAENEDDS